MQRFAIPCLLAGAVALTGCDDAGEIDITEPEVDRTFEVTIENVSTVFDFLASGAFDTPAGADAPGPLFPGGVYEFSFSAAPGTSLSLATMFVQSNDWFYAPDGDGIALWNDDGSQVTGDVTDRLVLWDAGTEADAEPGLGADQAPRQDGPDTGAADPDDRVRIAEDSWDNIPAVSDVIRLTLRSTGPTSWTATLRNVSTASTLATSDGMSHPVPLSPGVWVVHAGDDPLFTAGEPDRGEGLEAVAEDGAAGTLATNLGDRSGVTGPIAPGVYAVHEAPSVLFEAGMPDDGRGLEALAEDGAPSALASALGADAAVSASGAFDTPDGAAGPAPAFPGESYSFTFTASPGDRLSFATMLVQTNDLFFAPGEAGVDLFPNGTALRGEVTGMVLLWDAGTEVNQAPGIGLDQAPRQSGPDTGAAENGAVRQVNDGYRYPDVGDVIRVTIRPTS